MRNIEIQYCLHTVLYYRYSLNHGNGKIDPVLIFSIMKSMSKNKPPFEYRNIYVFNLNFEFQEISLVTKDHYHPTKIMGFRLLGIFLVGALRKHMYRQWLRKR